MPLTKLAQELGVPATNPLVVEQHGRSFTVKYYPGSKNSPPSLHVTAIVDETGDAVSFGAYRATGRAHVDTRPAILLRRETWVDRLGKRLGLNREVAIGDPELDALVYIETDSPEEDVQRTLADERLRAAVRALFASGVSGIHLDPTGLYVVLRGRASSQPSAAELTHTTALLAEAASALPLFNAGQATKPRSQLASMLVLILGCLAAPFMLGLSGSAPLDHAAKQIGVGGGFALWALAVVAMVVTLRGRSDSLRRIVLFSFAALFVLPSALYAGLVLTNRGLDESPATNHATTVTRTWTTRGKNSTYYHMEVATWRPGEGPVPLDVSQMFFNKVKAGTKMVVTTHEGKLGWEWVESFRVAP